MPVPVDTVFFAIKSALRLASAIKTAYLEATIDRPLVLPLPYFSPVDEASARAWFSDDEKGIEAARTSGRVTQLLKKAYLSPEESKELLDVYNVYYHEASNTREFLDHPGRVSGTDLGHALTIRMWGRDKASHPSALQRVGGTLVNVAVDYFAGTPEAVDERRPAGRALKAFLVSLDDTDFAEAPLRGLAGDLLSGVVESVAARPEILGRGPREGVFIAGVARSMAASATEFLSDPNTADDRDAGAWLGLAANAFLRGGADVVLANPALFLGDDPRTALVTDVGRVVADLVVGEKAPTFRKLLSGPGLETLSRAALAAVASRPEIVEDGRLKPLLLKLAEDLSGSPLDVAEISRLVLRRTGENLDVLWPADDPAEHLLVKTCAQLAAALAEKPAKGKWSPRLGGPQLLATAEALLDEVVDHPQWLLDKASPPVFQRTLGAMLAVLRTVDGRRLTPEGGLALLRAGMSAATARVSLASDGAAAVLRVVVDVLLDPPTPEALWTLARTSLAVAVGETVFRALARHGYAPEVLPRIEKLLRDLARNPATFAVEVLAVEIEALLAKKKKGKAK